MDLHDEGIRFKVISVMKGVVFIQLSELGCCGDNRMVQASNGSRHFQLRVRRSTAQ